MLINILSMQQQMFKIQTVSHPSAVSIHAWAIYLANNQKKSRNWKTNPPETKNVSEECWSLYIRGTPLFTLTRQNIIMYGSITTIITLIIHVYMWMMHPRLTQGILMEKCLSIRTPLPLVFTVIIPPKRYIFLPFVMSEWCRKELLLSVPFMVKWTPVIYLRGLWQLHKSRRFIHKKPYY